MNRASEQNTPLRARALWQRVLLATLSLACFVIPSPAPPPLVTGDVPTADRGMFELYTGFRYQDTGTISRQVPFTELVYGISTRQEITFELANLSRNGEHGIGDAVIGTKYVLFRETDQLPGLPRRSN